MAISYKKRQAYAYPTISTALKIIKKEIAPPAYLISCFLEENASFPSQNAPSTLKTQHAPNASQDFISRTPFAILKILPARPTIQRENASPAFTPTISSTTPASFLHSASIPFALTT